MLDFSVSHGFNETNGLFSFVPTDSVVIVPSLKKLFNWMSWYLNSWKVFDAAAAPLGKL